MWFLPSLMAAGTALSAYGQYRAGQSAARKQRFEARQMAQQAQQAQASSQREAYEVERQGRLLQSRALAVAAASGGGASDPTVMNQIARLAGETEYKKMVALYEGESRADALSLSAAVSRQDASELEKAGIIAAGGTVLSGGTSLYSKYGTK